MSLAQFVRLCDGALSALSRRHSSAAAAVVFARCRRGADERLSFESFVAAIALLATETGKTFEAVAAAAAAHAANGAPVVSPTARSPRPLRAVVPWRRRRRNPPSFREVPSAKEECSANEA